MGDNSGYWYCYDASDGVKLWSYKVSSYSYHATAAVRGAYVAIPTGSDEERNVHILKQTTSSPYFELHKSVQAVVDQSAEVQKANATSDGKPNVNHPWAKVSPEHLKVLMEMGPADREEFINDIADGTGANYDDLKEWLMLEKGEVDPDLNKASDQTGISYVSMDWGCFTSSPPFVDDMIVVTHRGLSGKANDGILYNRDQGGCGSRIDRGRLGHDGEEFRPSAAGHSRFSCYFEL